MIREAVMTLEPSPTVGDPFPATAVQGSAYIVYRKAVWNRALTNAEIVKQYQRVSGHEAMLRAQMHPALRLFADIDDALAIGRAHVARGWRRIRDAHACRDARRAYICLGAGLGLALAGGLAPAGALFLLAAFFAGRSR